MTVLSEDDLTHLAESVLAGKCTSYVAAANSFAREVQRMVQMRADHATMLVTLRSAQEVGTKKHDEIAALRGAVKTIMYEEDGFRRLNATMHILRTCPPLVGQRLVSFPRRT